MLLVRDLKLQSLVTSGLRAVTLQYEVLRVCLFGTVGRIPDASHHPLTRPTRPSPPRKEQSLLENAHLPNVPGIRSKRYIFLLPIVT